MIGREHLAALGVSDRQIYLWTQAGRLHRIHRGVYAVGHDRLGVHGRNAAAVLAVGQPSGLSHLPAAANWGTFDPPPSLPHITTPARRSQRKGMRLHFAPLPPDELTIKNRIPTTTVARTILDVAATTDRYITEQVMAQAEFHHLLKPGELEMLLQRYNGRRGTATVHRILDAGLHAKGVTKSWLERRFLPFLDRHNLPRPELNVRLELNGTTIEVDCLWRSKRLAVELDGRASHIRAKTFESDRARDRKLTVAGWKPMRITKIQLEADETELARDLGALLIRSLTT